MRDRAWSQEPDPDDKNKLTLVRNVKKVDVFDVSPVTFPAYPQTSVDLRSIALGVTADVERENEYLAIRARLASID